MVKELQRNMGGQRVLITGGLGFIGSNLAQECIKRGAEVTIYDNLDSRFGGNNFNIESVKNSINIVYGDVLDFENLSSQVRNKEIIFNCAAATSHPFSMREPFIDLDINCKGTLHLLEAIRKVNPKTRLVHLGTTTQIGRLRYSPADENHPEFPTDIYSTNKSASEKYVLVYSGTYKFPATVVRLPNVFGPRAAIHSKEFNFVNYFIGLGLQNKPLTVYGDGSQVRNLLYIKDCVSALIHVAEREITSNNVLFAVGDKTYNVAEIANSIVKYIGGSVDFVDWPDGRKSIDVGDAIISNKRIKESLDWTPRYSLKEGLIETEEYYKNCLNNYLRLK